MSVIKKTFFIKAFIAIALNAYGAKSSNFCIRSFLSLNNNKSYSGLYDTYNLSEDEKSQIDTTKKILDKKLKYTDTSSAYIDKQGEVHTLGERYDLEVRPSEFDWVYVFGQIKLIEGSEYVNFKIWQEGEQKIIGREDNYIRQMPFNEFYKLAIKSYRENILKEGQYVLLPHKERANQYSVLRVVKVGQFRVGLLTNNNKTISVSIKNVFKNNFFLDKTERDLLNDFFRNGGRGNAYYLSSAVATRENYKYTGLYIRPTYGPESFFDNKDIVKIINQETHTYNLLLTTDYKTLHGAYFSVHETSKLSELFLNGKDFQGYIVVTPSTSAHVFKHELQHYKDDVEELDLDLIKGMREILAGNIIIELPDLLALLKFVHEQRAYVVEERSIYLDSITSKTQKEKMINDSVENFNELYEAPYYEILNNIRIQNEEVFFQLSRFFEQYLFESENYL